MPEPLLSVRELTVEYLGTDGRSFRAADRVSLEIAQGEVLALVGESGCGKTTVAMALVGLVAASGGEAVFDGLPLPRREKDWRAWRRRIGVVFQDPFASLDPLWSVQALITEPLVVQGGMGRAEMRARARELAELVGLDVELLPRRPHELSGGQRQRVAIARALSAEPKLLIADEPTSALDMSIRAQVLNLLRDLQQRLNLAVLFVSHDLATVRYLADRVAVMYAGRLVEIGPAEQVVGQPLHPYSQALIRSMPEIGEFGSLPPVLEGEVPDPSRLPSGCAFRTRCRYARDLCAEREPEQHELGTVRVRCHFAPEIVEDSLSRHA
ncbi:MAG: ABC transporter ATP-binding protein [Fimbriimonadales bacterium]